MTTLHQEKEIEVKIPLKNPTAAQRRLRRAGFKLLSRATEQDLLLDTPEGLLRSRRCLLRLRRHGRNWLLTFKGPAENDPLYKAREEIQTAVPDGQRLQLILERLGFRPVFAYEKRRRIFRRHREPGLVMLDHTPIGHYLELEGSRDWIDRTARDLSFSPADYVTKSYGQLYLEYCREQGVEPTHMLFLRPSK